MKKHLHLLILLIVIVISGLSILIEQKTNIFHNLSSLLFLQYVLSIVFNLFLLKYLFKFKKVALMFSRVNILIWYVVYTIILIAISSIILNIDYSSLRLRLRLTEVILSILYLFTMSFLTQFLICETLKKINFKTAYPIYISSILMLILVIFITLPIFVN